MSNNFNGQWPMPSNAAAILIRVAGLLEFRTSAEFNKAVGDLQRKIDLGMERLNKVANAGPKTILEEQAKLGVDAVVEGTPFPQGGMFRSANQIRENIRAEIRAIKAGLAELAGRAAAVIRPEAVRFEAEVREYADDLQESETRIAEDIGVVFEPSKNVRDLRGALSTILPRMPAPGAPGAAYGSPKNYITWR